MCLGKLFYCQSALKGRYRTLSSKRNGEIIVSDKPATIAIADKNPVIRTGLSELLRQDGRFHVAAAVSTGAAFVELVCQSKIDVALVGWSLPDMTGGDVLGELSVASVSVSSVTGITSGKDR